MLPAIEANPVSGKFNILHSSVLHHLPNFSMRIQSCWIVPYVTKIFQNILLTLMYIYIYIYRVHGSICDPGFHAFCICRTEYMKCMKICLTNVKCMKPRVTDTLAHWVECLPMAQETRAQSQVESYKRFKKRYLISPCLTLSIIRYVSRVKWSNPRKGEAPFPTPQWSSFWKRETSDCPQLQSPTFMYIRKCSIIDIENYLTILQDLVIQVSL